MPLLKDEWIKLENKANELRNLCLDTTYWVGSGHIGGAMSAMDIMTVLYHKYMTIDVNNPDMPERDRFFLSKGHSGIGYIAVLADLGFKDKLEGKSLKEQLKTFNLTGSKLGMHLDATKVEGVDASTGSLGHGLSIALGTALAARLTDRKYTTYCLLGDGECNEGAVWEAAMSAAHFKATNMITFVDRNNCMIDGRTEDVMRLEPFADKWRAFGFNVLEIDGQNIKEICNAIDTALDNKTDKPYCIIAKTCKGAGICFMEDDYRWHYGAIDSDKYKEAQESLEMYHKERLERASK